MASPDLSARSELCLLCPIMSQAARNSCSAVPLPLTEVNTGMREVDGNGGNRVTNFDSVMRPFPVISNRD